MCNCCLDYVQEEEVPFDTVTRVCILFWVLLVVRFGPTLTKRLEGQNLTIKTILCFSQYYITFPHYIDKKHLKSGVSVKRHLRCVKFVSSLQSHLTFHITLTQKQHTLCSGKVLETPNTNEMFDYTLWTWQETQLGRLCSVAPIYSDWAVYTDLIMKSPADTSLYPLTATEQK